MSPSWVSYSYWLSWNYRHVCYVLTLSFILSQDLVQYHEQQQKTLSPGKHRAGRVLMGFVHLCTILAFVLALVDVFASEVPPIELVVPQMMAALPAAVHLLETTWVLAWRAKEALRGKLVRPYQRVSSLGTPEMEPFKTLFYD
jgi:hypothetical protein